MRRLTVGLSVSAAIVVGVIRIIKGWPIQWFILGGYVGVVIMTAFAPPDIIGIAYDSGGVTTNIVTVPLVMMVLVFQRRIVEGLTSGAGK